MFVVLPNYFDSPIQKLLFSIENLLWTNATEDEQVWKNFVSHRRYWENLIFLYFVDIFGPDNIFVKRMKNYNSIDIFPHYWPWFDQHYVTITMGIFCKIFFRISGWKKLFYWMWSHEPKHCLRTGRSTKYWIVTTTDWLVPSRASRLHEVEIRVGYML